MAEAAAEAAAEEVPIIMVEAITQAEQQVVDLEGLQQAEAAVAEATAVGITQMKLLFIMVEALEQQAYNQAAVVEAVEVEAITSIVTEQVAVQEPQVEQDKLSYMKRNLYNGYITRMH
jgi:hypothetical protein